jgi:hypothetical protein
MSYRQFSENGVDKLRRTQGARTESAKGRLFARKNATLVQIQEEQQPPSSVLGEALNAESGESP